MCKLKVWWAGLLSCYYTMRGRGEEKWEWMIFRDQKCVQFELTRTGRPGI